LQPAVDRADVAIARARDFNSEQASVEAARIEQIRRRSVHLTWALDGASALAAVVMAVLAARLVRQRAELLERKADELEQFAGRVAHDLVSPLATVAMAAQLVRQRTGDDHKAAALLERIDRSLVSVRQVVDGLLGFARAGALPEEAGASELAPAVDGAFDLLRDEAAAKGIALRAEAVAGCRLGCTPGVLASLLWNLVGNAVKFIGDSPVRTVLVRARRLGDAVRVEVEDSGPGLPLGRDRTVFEPFVRLGDRGLPGIGLGLATVRRLVMAHGGAVGVRPAPGRGAIFWFELPRG
jgi:signal transduction histidine kinase